MPVLPAQNIVVLISGTGSNLAAILQAAERGQWRQRYGAQVVAVISSRADATGLHVARQHGIATALVAHAAFAESSDPRTAFDAALQSEIDRHQPALVVLAGFMRILTSGFVAHYAGRLMNIHPSLLPAFAGLNTHARALAAGCQFAGATVHWVSAEVDAGGILAQAVVPVLPGDTPAQLAARVLLQEHQIYPAAIEKLLQARVALGEQQTPTQWIFQENTIK
ncbi:MAG: phosphoribosylglycinamide formyltransferase [Burkholderiales bacterium]